MSVTWWPSALSSVAKVLMDVDTPLTRGKKTSEIKSIFI